MAAAKWTRFVQQCLLRRTSTGEFRELAEYLNESHPITGAHIVTVLLGCRNSFSVPSDPLIIQYVRAIILSGFANLSDVLLGLIRTWNNRKPDSGLTKEIKEPGALSSPDTALINHLAPLLASNKASLAATEVHKSLLITSKWLVALIRWITDDGENRSYVAILTLLDALGILLAALMSTEVGMIQLGSQGDSELKTAVSEALEIAIPCISTISAQLHGRLELLQKHFGLYQTVLTEEDANLIAESEPVPDVLQFEASVEDLPTSNTRAGLFVHLNAALCGIPMADDASLINHLNIRYGGDHSSMFSDVIIASFDVLSNAHGRGEAPPAMSLYRSFLTNKLPPLLSHIVRLSLEPIPVNLCISQALARIDQGVFPLSAYDMERSSALVGVREEFLFACALHRLIPEASIQTFLGESPLQTLPSHGLYEKGQVLTQMSENSQKLEKLVREMDLMEGNAGVIVAATVEMIHSHCRNRDTQPLMELCNYIVRQSQAIDVMALFARPSQFLGPLCSLLDNWNWDEIHGESQPVYEEFGAVLLLVLCAVDRLQLSSSELGILAGRSFVRQLLDQDATEKGLNELDDSQREFLGQWISAFFVADSLSDELTSACSPQDFYLLVPTLISQSLDAFASKQLTVDALKSGFDYLREPFLHPSLCIGLKLLAAKLWKAGAPSKAALILIQSLIKPLSSTESRELHQSILFTVADKIQFQLRTMVVPDGPQRQLITSINDSLDPYTFHRRDIHWNLEPFLTNASWPKGSLFLVSQKIQRLLSWCTSLDATAGPPRFTYKLILASIDLHGASKVASCLLTELKLHIGTTNLGAALDLVTSMVVAPQSSNAPSTRQLSLFDAIKMEYSDLAKVLKKGDTLYAQALVCLHRRIDLFAMLPQPVELDLDAAASLAPDLTSIDLQNINLATAAANAELDVGNISGQPDVMELDRMLEGGIGLDDFSTNIAPTGTDDVFGLGSGDLSSMNFDDMDFGMY